MKDFQPETFGQIYASDYDVSQDPGTTDETVALIADLAGSGRILELAVGTGRVALPLSARGLDVHGIDASEEMLEVLRKKDGADKVALTAGDYADVAVDAQFDFIYLIYNTITNLTTQEDQVRCLQNVSNHLNPRGAFLVETFVPDLTQFKDHQYARTLEVDIDTAILDLGRHDPVHQLVESQRIVMTNEGTQMRPLPYRYVWPQELDLMAQLAGLRLESRWGDWHRGTFNRDSTMHVSLYRKSGDG